MTDRDDILAFARRRLAVPEGVPLVLTPLSRRGSDRSFYRLAYGAGSFIVIDYETKRAENAYYADIALFLRSIGVSVPRVIAHDPVLRIVVSEDLGDEDLWSFRARPWDERRPLYEGTIATIVNLHAYPPGDLVNRGLQIAEPFGPGLYRWERDYFRERFVRDLCGIDQGPSAAAALEQELAALAEGLHQGPHSLLHRDLQSQNVMVRDGEVFLIDFQGVRLGNPLYDLASLLYDPYVDLTEGERYHLADFYHGLSNCGLSLPTFRKCLWEAASQRLMQALGAYGFLGLTKGLRSFLLHIPAALRNLQLAAAQAGSLPCLGNLVGRCLAAVEEKALTFMGSGPG